MHKVDAHNECFVLQLVFPAHSLALAAIVNRVALTISAITGAPLGNVIHLPTIVWEHVFVPLEPLALDDFAGVTLLLFDPRIADHADVVVHVKVEKWAGLASGLVDDELVEGVVVRDDQVFLDVHQRVDAVTSQFWDLRTTLLQEVRDGVALFALSTGRPAESTVSCQLWAIRSR